MRVLQQNNILTRQSENLIKSELSNVAMVVQSPQIMATYFSINADATTLVGGFKNIEEFIGKDSSVLYDRIENLPMCGVENLVMMTEYNDETGHDVNFSAQGLIFPNTIVPKPGDCFYLHGAVVPALYVVTDFTRTVVRSNTFTEINFVLWSQNQKQIEQVEKQVKDQYRVVVTSLGADKTLVIKDENYFNIQRHLESYLEAVDMYVSMFYTRTKSMFTYGEQYDKSANMPATIVDMVLWKFLYDTGTIVYDQALTFAANNFNAKIKRVYIDDPSQYIDNFEYKKTPFYRVIRRDKRRKLDEYSYPVFTKEDIQRTKTQGFNLYFIEKYQEESVCKCDPCDCEELDANTFRIFDDEFLYRIIHNERYRRCEREPASGINYSIRNAIIQYYNFETIDFDTIEIDDHRTLDNFYLLPILLAIYKDYITGLQ